ncbi:Uu.00g020570.m01.CDS01 [Anthostomella pinea]|uniref:Uu.00g020570.m01.CDS01 n=1 Tax=Anthostomella pinea TaxID=933095 RepID=A0AAI8YQS3_9PEZI|nr:Uu.00g020570.m01.CDS01 [Anthostomella pinea]
MWFSAFKTIGEGAYMAEKAGEPNPWEIESGNCLMEIKARLYHDHSKGYFCEAAASPPSPSGDRDEQAFTTESYDCSMNSLWEFEFPDAPDRKSAGTVRVVWTAEGGKDYTDEDGKKQKYKKRDGLDRPGLLFEDLETDHASKTNGKKHFCNFERYDDMWNSYRCGVPCKDADQNADASIWVNGG